MSLIDSKKQEKVETECQEEDNENMMVDEDSSNSNESPSTNGCNDKILLNPEQSSDSSASPTNEDVFPASNDISGRNITDGNAETTKDSDVNLNTSDDNSQSSNSLSTIPNTARRGKKRKCPETKPMRETPRRTAARKVKTYNDDEAFNDEEGVDDPDFKFSDSDDDPDFDPSRNKFQEPNSPEIDIHPRRSKGSKGRPRGAITPGKTSSLTSENRKFSPTSNDTNTDYNPLSPTKRRGRPPTYASDTKTNDISDNTVSSTDDRKSPGKLSSAYNYAVSRTRQNQAIRLPEGPNLTEDQLKLIESQFKSGDFVMAKKDIDMMENPPIWRIDGKSLLQKFQAFEKTGKFLYRNISTYSGWTSQAKALYVSVKVKFVFQSRYDTVVELLGFKSDDSENEPQTQIIDKPVWLPKNKDVEKITEELRIHMPSFEIYLQTLISQALDNNFLTEIYDESDAYFVDRVKGIDDLAEDRRQKILNLIKWDEKFQMSLDKWPCVNTMVTKNNIKCQACGKKDATMLSQFYGQPYDRMTLRSKEPSGFDLENKNYETCDSCSTMSQLFNKVTHQKYEYYSQCKSTVTNTRVSQPNKSTTNVLRDLLANDDWISGMFRSMCAAWIKIDNLVEHQMSNNKNEEKTTEVKIDSDKKQSEVKDLEKSQSEIKDSEKNLSEVKDLEKSQSEIKDSEKNLSEVKDSEKSKSKVVNSDIPTASDKSQSQSDSKKQNKPNLLSTKQSKPTPIETDESMSTSEDSTS